MKPPKSTVSFREAFKVWVRVALLSFGGPAGQIAVMHRILVEEKKWVDENRFLHALNYCMLLPGPEAQQLATYIGWLLHRTAGGLTAGLLFVLPGFISILVLSMIYASFQQVRVVESFFFGLKAAVLAVVIEAVIRIGKKALKTDVMVMLSAAAFISIFFFNMPFPILILSAGILGFLGGQFWVEKFNVIKPSQVAGFHVGDSIVVHTQPSLGRSLKVIGVGSAIWFLPLVLLWTFLGPSHVLVREAVFFSKTAVVTFGGAYSVLAYVAQEAVHTYGWLAPGEMLDGLGMAETTPGPLIQVLQFVGFMGAYRHPAPFTPMTAAILGSIVTTWMTFAPCFLWIFLGAPWIEHLRGHKLLNSALSAVTAAVVGVVLNLAVWFSLHVIFDQVRETQHWGMRFYIPSLATLNPDALLIAVGACVALFRFHQNMLVVLGVSAVIGLVYRMMFAG